MNSDDNEQHLVTIKRIRTSIKDKPITDKEELILLTDAVGSLHSHLLEQVQPGLSEPRQNETKKPPKKKPSTKHVDEVCPGLYWRTPEVIEQLKALAEQKKGRGRRPKIEDYVCNHSTTPKYRGPGDSDTAKFICGTCKQHYKKDKDAKVVK